MHLLFVHSFRHQDVHRFKQQLLLLPAGVPDRLLDLQRA
jgi:hypothetical protein